MESRGTLNREPFTRRYVNSDWPLDARPDDASLHLADAWLTWVGQGPIRGPDGVEVTIWVRFAGQDLPFHYTASDQAWLTRAELRSSRAPTDGVVAVSVRLGRGLLWVPQRARARWRRVRTGRR